MNKYLLGIQGNKPRPRTVIGLNFSFLRHHLNITQQAFADLFTTDKLTIDRIERFRMSPDKTLLRRVGDYFGLSDTQLLISNLSPENIVVALRSRPPELNIPKEAVELREELQSLIFEITTVRNQAVSIAERAEKSLASLKRLLR